MSWTVHEDEYRTGGYDNLEEILQFVVHTEENADDKPTGKYTKSSQVFATPSPLTAADLSSPKKQQIPNMAPWQQHYHTPTSSSQPGMAMPYNTSHSSPQKRFNNRYNSNYNSQFDRPSKNATDDSYIPSPSAGKRGINVAHMDHVASMELSNMQVPDILMTKDLFSSQDMMAGGAYADWTACGSKYQQPAALSADNLRGRVYETAKDQHGCRFLQRWLDTNCEQETVLVIMNEIIPHVAELMTDQYANFLVQKLFDIMPDDVRYKVAVVASPQISLIAVTPHGTFSVQKMIETISTRKEMEIIREALSKDVVRLVKDAHGNHVIQKVLQRFGFGDKEFIYKAVASDCVAIAKNKQGCCVLQRCLEYASPQQKAALVDQILSCCLDIVQDPFGNYVLQYILEANDSKINDTIALAFLPRLVHLCMNKFSSNVMEKVLRGASQPVKEMYVEEMCHYEIISRLILDGFGNYVLQTALTINAPPQAEQLVAAIRPFLPLIKNTPYAKKLEGKMDAVIRKMESEGFRSNREQEIMWKPGNGSSSHVRYDV